MQTGTNTEHLDTGPLTLPMSQHWRVEGPLLAIQPSPLTQYPAFVYHIPVTAEPDAQGRHSNICVFPYLYYVCMLMFTQCLLLTYVPRLAVLLQSFHYQCTSYSSLWNTCLPCDFLTHLSCWHWNSSKECLHRSQSASTSEQANTHHTQLMRVLTTQKQNTEADRANRDGWL